MLRRWLGGAAALLVLGLTVSARAAEDGTAPSSDNHWWDRINPFAGKKPDVPSPTTSAATRAGPAAAPTPVVRPVIVHETEEAALMRRNDVCDKLKQIAWDTNNKELERRADMLQLRVNEVYKLHAGMTAAKSESDEAVPASGGSRHEFGPTERARTIHPREDQE